MNMKKTFLGLCDLGQHVNKTGYVLLQYASGVLVEPIIPISNQEMDSSGISMVLDYIRHPPGPDSKQMNYFDEATKKKQLKIKRDFTLITLSLELGEGEELKVAPLHAGHGWSFDCRADEIRIFPLPMTNEKFLEVLRDAFEVAS